MVPQLVAAVYRNQPCDFAGRWLLKHNNMNEMTGKQKLSLNRRAFVVVFLFVLQVASNF